MAIDWDKLPDGEMKYELLAYMRQLEAVEDLGPTPETVGPLIERFRDLSENVRKLCLHLISLHLVLSIPVYVTAVDELLLKTEDVIDAARINMLRGTVAPEQVN